MANLDDILNALYEVGGVPTDETHKEMAIKVAKEQIKRLLLEGEL